MIAKFLNFLVVAILVMLGVSLQGCSGGGAETAPAAGTSVASTATDVVVTLSVKDSLGNATSALAADTEESAWVVATVKDSAGNAITSATVEFSLSNSAAASLPITSAQVVNGTAQVSLQARQDGAGAAYVMASVLMPDGSRAASGRYGFTVFSNATGSGKIILGAITMASPVSAHGSATVSLPVSVVHSVSIDNVPNAYPVAVPMAVTLTSACVQAGKATISTALSDVDGVAKAVYQDNGCANSDTITATVAGGGMWAAGPTRTSSVSALASSNLKFVSASTTKLFARGLGFDNLAQTAVVKFKVLNTAGAAKAGEFVWFSLVSATETDASLSSAWQISDANGEVSVSVSAGALPAHLNVKADLLSGFSVLATGLSDTIGIAGLPTQDYFYLNISRHNIEADATAVINVIAYDRRGNPAPQGTVVNFVSEGGTLQGSTQGQAQCLTNQFGACSIRLKNTEYRPIGEQDLFGRGVVAAKDGSASISIDRYGQAAQPVYVQNGRVSLVAYAAGEKSFTDKNGNGRWDADEVYFDMGNPLLDRNEDGKMTTDLLGVALEPQISSAISGSEACAAHDKSSPVELIFDHSVLNPTYVDALNATNTCNNSMDGAKSGAWVRRNAVIVFSGSSPRVNKDYYLGPLCSGTLSFWLMDENGNPLPQGTTLDIANVQLSYLQNPANPFSAVAASASMATTQKTVPDSTHAGGTQHQVTVTAAGCNITDPPFTGNVQGTFNIKVTLPSGAVTTIPYGVNNH